MSCKVALPILSCKENRKVTLTARNICSFQVERRIKTEFILRKEKRFYFFGYTLLLTDNGDVKARTKDAPGYFSVSPQKLHHMYKRNSLIKIWSLWS